MKRAALAGVLLAAAPCAAQAPACDAEAAALVDVVASSIARYGDAEAARIDGYRPISFDFPGMGEHWINLRHAAVDRFDPTKPPILLYARRNEEALLVGAAFITLRDPGETTPGPAALRHGWHEHAGTLDEELFAANHHSRPDRDRFAVLVLHVWSTPPLGGGWFDVQNWRLPWLRAGVEPWSASPDAARSLSLLHSRRYFADYLIRNGVPHDESPALDAMLHASGAEVAALLDVPSGETATEALELSWRRLTDGIRSRWPDTRAALDRLDADPRVRLACDL